MVFGIRLIWVVLFKFLFLFLGPPPLVLRMCSDQWLPAYVHVHLPEKSFEDINYFIHDHLLYLNKYFLVFLFS